jgi:hypothetical protein
MQTEAIHLDGNAAGGVLRDVFAHEMTAALASCGGCGAVAALGALSQYGHTMGIVLRCPTCDTPVLRIVRTPGLVRLDLCGIRRLTIPDSARSRKPMDRAQPASTAASIRATNAATLSRSWRAGSR